jgi:Phage integrase, N-terminal SAM-like domain
MRACGRLSPALQATGCRAGIAVVIVPSFSKASISRSSNPHSRSTSRVCSPLRRRMIEDMSIRKFAAKTQHYYVQRVKEFAAFLGRSPDTAKSEDVRGFRLHLASHGARNSSSM